MQIAIPVCPECGNPVTGIIEQMRCTTQLEQEADGSFDYSGTTDYDYDSLVPVREQLVSLKKDQLVPGRTLVTCADGHEWYTEIQDDD